MLAGVGDSCGCRLPRASSSLNACSAWLQFMETCWWMLLSMYEDLRVDRTLHRAFAGIQSWLLSLVQI